jgi:ribulose-5-phosphate 4-epimerase/fuculose-1-phosphate aldolase
MTTSTLKQTAPFGEDMSDEEWQARVDLAACYRVVDYFGMSELIRTHISARVPGTAHVFLMKPDGLLFEEVTASSLVKLDVDGNVISDPTQRVNKAGFTIHSAVHMARADAQCVLHVHTRDGTAVSAQKNGLLPLSQHSARFHGDIGYHDYEGIALDLDERERLIAHLGGHSVLMLRNHGLLTIGRSMAEAFNRAYYLELACQVQIAAQASGAELIYLPQDVCERTAAQVREFGPLGERDWPALLRLLDRQSSDYRH